MRPPRYTTSAMICDVLLNIYALIDVRSLIMCGRTCKYWRAAYIHIYNKYAKEACELVTRRPGAPGLYYTYLSNNLIYSMNTDDNKHTYLSKQTDTGHIVWLWCPTQEYTALRKYPGSGIYSGSGIYYGIYNNYMKIWMERKFYTKCIACGCGMSEDTMPHPWNPPMQYFYDYIMSYTTLIMNPDIIADCVALFRDGSLHFDYCKYRRSVCPLFFV
jgi:hypothetical protein